ncbi:MAG: RDD family protein [Deltaproteobacteria bacterium]|nr:RDD family protein [Deltaproteobacteria bacterium]
MSITCPGCQRTLRDNIPRCPMCGTDLQAPPSDPAAPQTDPAVPGAAPTPTAASAAIVYSGFWRRVVAFSIDGCIIQLARIVAVWFCFTLGIQIFSEIAHLSAGAAFGAAAASIVGLVLLSLLLGLVYFAAFESSSFRATPGKIIMQAYVGNENAEPISFGRALFRNLAKVVSAIPLGLGYVMAAFSARKQALHDHIASTLVLREPGATVSRFVGGLIILFILNVVEISMARRAQQAYDLRPRLQIDGLSSSEPAPEAYVAPEEITPAEELPPTALPEESEADSQPSPNLASVNGVSVELPFQIAFLKSDGSEIVVGLYLTEPTAERIEELKQERLFNDPSLLQADLTLGFKFKRGSVECSAKELSSYFVSFRNSPQGFTLPDNKPAIEFARAVTSERSREGLGLGCEKLDGKDLVVGIRGEGGKIANTSESPYTWTLAFKAPLILVE